MPYLSEILGTQVVDASGEKIGSVSDVGAAIGEVFPSITALAFKGPANVPFMISWRKYVKECTEDLITLNVNAADVRFSYLQPNELLLGRDLMNKQIVDTLGMKVVRVNDLKLSRTDDDQLRLLGAEVGARGILRGIAPGLEHIACTIAEALGQPIPEKIIAWSYMDLLDRNLSQVRLSVSHKSLVDMHPADIADIIEQLDPRLRSQVFSRLDAENAADAMAELDDDLQADVIDDLPERKASAMIAQMDPDDAADIIGELSYEKAEKILDLMGVKEEKAIRQLLGYPKDTAGGLMTSEFIAMQESSTVGDVKQRIAGLDKDFEPVYSVYVLDAQRKLTGVISMRDLLVSDDQATLASLAYTDLITVSPEESQTIVATEMAKYSLVGMPVVDDEGLLLGIVTVDDALDVIEDEHERDLQLATGSRGESLATEKSGGRLSWFLRRELWFLIWVALGTLCAYILPAALPAVVLCFLPIVLLVADDMSLYASSYLIEDERPPIAGLIARNLFVGVVMGALGWLIVRSALLIGIVPPGFDESTINIVLAATVVTVIVLVALATPYTLILERRVADGRSFSTAGASIAWMVVAGTLLAGLSVLFSFVLEAL